MAVKYYAVAVGKKPGIYTKWDECKAMVHGFPGAVYKRVLRRWKKRRRFWKAHRRVGRNSCKRSGAAEGNAREQHSRNQEQPETARQRREVRNLPERQRICRRITRSWMALFTPVPACTVMEVFDSCRRKRSAARCGEGSRRWRRCAMWQARF